MASTPLIPGYSAAIRPCLSRAAVMAGVLAGLYGFLYVTLKAENLALVGGSIGLGIVLALLMYLTRRIDWYAARTDGQKQAIAD